MYLISSMQRRLLVVLDAVKEGAVPLKDVRRKEVAAVAVSVDGVGVVSSRVGVSARDQRHVTLSPKFESASATENITQLTRAEHSNIPPHSPSANPVVHRPEMGKSKHQSRFGLTDIIARKNGGSPQKPPKRAAVWMDTSDNESDVPTRSPKFIATKGAHKVHHQAKKTKMHHHKTPKGSTSLEEQRKQLPIAEGSSLTSLHTVAIFT